MPTTLKNTWLIILTLFAALIVSGIEFTQTLYSYNTHRLILVGLLATLPLLIAASSVSFPKNKFIAFTLIICLAIGLISSNLSAYPDKSLTGYWLITSLLVASICFYHMNLGTIGIAIIACIITACFMLYICVYYLDYLLDISNNKATIKGSRVFHGFDNERFLNHVQTLTIPLSIIAINLISNLRQLSLKFKFLILSLIYFSTSSYIALVFISSGRGTIFSSLASIVILWLILGRSFNYVGKKICILWLAGITLFVAQKVIYMSAVSNGKVSSINAIVDITTDGRLDLWLIALEYIKQNPLLGIGPLMYGETTATIFNSPHNVILWFASEWGLISSTAIISLAIYLLFLYMLRLRDASLSIPAHGNQPLLQIVIAQVLGLSLIAGTIHSLVSGIYIVPSSQLIAMLIVILAFSSYQILGERSAPPDSSSIQLPMRYRIGVALFLMVLLLPAYRYHQSSDWGRLTSEDIKNEQHQLTPAYWLQGDR